MKKSVRIISLLLAVLLLTGTFGFLSIFDTAAKEAAADTTEEEEDDITTIDYTTKAYANDEDKLATMEKMVEKASSDVNGKKTFYQLYVDKYSGEVAEVYCDEDGKIINCLFTNPYDVGLSNASTPIKQQILSQIIVQYTNNDTEKYFYSYEGAAIRNQIKVKNIKNGVRVEYTIGREEARMLLPRMITKERYEQKLLLPLAQAYGFDTLEMLEEGKQRQAVLKKKLQEGKLTTEEAEEKKILDSRLFSYNKFDVYYVEKNLENAKTARAQAALLAAFPIVKKYAVYIFDPEASDAEKYRCENKIKENCPEYSYEDLDYDHELTEYQSEEENPPMFKMALEYLLDSEGMTVRLPANGIRFNEALYQLSNITVLPYMGAGNNSYDGFCFYPDGSGTLFNFADPALKTKISITGKVYGSDFAYHTISGSFQKTIRYPVFGIEEDTTYNEYYNADEDSENYGDNIGTIATALVEKISKLTDDKTSDFYKKYYPLSTSNAFEVVKKSRGFVAVIEEGDALASISASTDATESEYSTMRMQFNPRPKDSYNIADSISVGTNSTWTVVCSRKYVGNYKIRYTMLTSEETAKENNITDYYTTSWFGMAVAYRDYLEKNGTLTRLKASDVQEDIPLYIETFGTVETMEKILSVPVNVMTPLTTFENVQTMYSELSDEGIKNINFKLTGYANGGMYSNVPYDLYWEKSVGGNSGFQQLLDYTAEQNKSDDKHVEIFPEFEFSYASLDGLFDAFVLKQHATKAIDDRYVRRQEYMATMQKFVSMWDRAISPAYMSNFYEHFISNYLDNYSNVTGISVSSLGNTLNSDFDEDEPYNREDSKEFVLKAFEYFDKAGLNIMIDGGNAYTWKYADHILGVSLDSSRYIKATYSVPFVGVVLHGYVQFTDDPLNMEGDIQYATLKAIENGASIYFTLSYQNTQELKDFYDLSRYYSIRYDIWKEDLVNKYLQLNAALSDVQTKLIIDHKFIDGKRVPDADEMKTDVEKIMAEYEEYERVIIEEEDKLKSELVGNARKSALEVLEKLEKYISNSNGTYSGILSMYNQVPSFDNTHNYIDYIHNINQFIIDGYDKLGNAENEDDIKKYQDYQSNINSVVKTMNAVCNNKVYQNIYLPMYKMKESYDNYTKLIAEAYESVELLKNTPDINEDIIESTYNTVKTAEFLLNSGYFQVTNEFYDGYLDAVVKANDSEGKLYNIQDEFARVKALAHKIAMVRTMTAMNDSIAKIDSEYTKANKAYSDNIVKLAKLLAEDYNDYSEIESIRNYYNTDYDEAKKLVDEKSSAKSEADKGEDASAKETAEKEYNEAVEAFNKVRDTLYDMLKKFSADYLEDAVVKATEAYDNSYIQNSLAASKLKKANSELDNVTKLYEAADDAGKVKLQESYDSAVKKAAEAKETADKVSEEHTKNQKIKTSLTSAKTAADNLISSKTTYETAKFNTAFIPAAKPVLEGMLGTELAGVTDETTLTVEGIIHYIPVDGMMEKLVAECIEELNQELYDKTGIQGTKTEVEHIEYSDYFEFNKSLKEICADSEVLYNETKAYLLSLSDGLDSLPETYKINDKYLNNIIENNMNKTKKEEEEEEEEEYDKYESDDGKIVVVTYGEGKEAYKAFIINYNSYSVRVEYNNRVYTIGKYSYVTIPYEEVQK